MGLGNEGNGSFPESGSLLFWLFLQWRIFYLSQISTLIRICAVGMLSMRPGMGRISYVSPSLGILDWGPIKNHLGGEYQVGSCFLVQVK